MSVLLTCPLCTHILSETQHESKGVKVDICNSCSGIWLDKGELHKSIESKKIVVDTSVACASVDLADKFEFSFGILEFAFKLVLELWSSD